MKYCSWAVASEATKSVLDNFIEDYAKEMERILIKELEKVSCDFILSEKEIEDL